MAFRDYGISNGFIVDQSGNGDFTTIQAAINAATGGMVIGINPGTYTENLTLKQSVNLVGFAEFGGTSGVLIVGKAIDNGSTLGMTIANVGLQTNSDYILSLTGATSYILLDSCLLQCSNHTGMSATSGNTINAASCYGNLGTTGIAFYTGSGIYLFYQCNFTNQGNSTTVSSASQGSAYYGCAIASPIGTTGAGTLDFFSSTSFNFLNNAICLTTAGTGTTRLFSSQFYSGTASAISVGAGTTVTITTGLINSSNTNAIAGSGTLNIATTVFPSSSTLQGTLTVNNLTVI